MKSSFPAEPSMRSVFPVTFTFVDERSTLMTRSSTAIRGSSHIRLLVAIERKTIAPAPIVSCT